MDTELKFENAAKAIQEFGAAMRNIKWPQIYGRAIRNIYSVDSYEWASFSYRQQPADVRHTTQLEF